MDPKVGDRREFDAVQLMREHPPCFIHKNKRAVFAESLRPGDIPAGRVTFTRWSGAALPKSRPGTPAHLVERDGFFVYGETAPTGTVHCT